MAIFKIHSWHILAFQSSNRKIRTYLSFGKLFLLVLYSQSDMLITYHSRKLLVLPLVFLCHTRFVLNSWLCHYFDPIFESKTPIYDVSGILTWISLTYILILILDTLEIVLNTSLKTNPSFRLYVIIITNYENGYWWKYLVVVKSLTLTKSFYHQTCLSKGN